MNYNIYDWVFVNNPYTKKWMATRREHYDDLFSNIDSEHIIKSSDVNTLIKLIEKTNGNKEEIAKLLAEQEKKTAPPTPPPSREITEGKMPEKPKSWQIKTGKTDVV